MTRLQNQPSPAVAPEPVPAPPGTSPPTRQQFIPLRKDDLVETLARGDLTVQESAAFLTLCRTLGAQFHCEFQTALEELKNAYAPFDPDSDTRPAEDLGPEQLDARRQALFERFGWMLERGNFVRLAQTEIDRALAECSQWGLNLAVNFEVFDRLELYYRGDVVGTRYRRRLRNRFRAEAVEVPIFQRLVVIFHLRAEGRYSKFLDTHDVHIKLFKDIPKVDLEMLLPGTEVKMSLFDRARIMLPTLSGVSIAIWKILLVATAPLYTSLAFLGLVGGTVGYGVRSLFGYLNTKQKYQLNLTQSLYYQNLDNNAGVIHRLLDEAEEQECREAILAYYFLWRAGAGLTADELDRRIEAFLRTQVEQDVDFEVGDALGKLARFNIVDNGPGGAWRALPIEQALETLALRWTTLTERSAP